MNELNDRLLQLNKGVADLRNLFSKIAREGGARMQQNHS